MIPEDVLSGESAELLQSVPITSIRVKENQVEVTGSAGEIQQLIQLTTKVLDLKWEDLRMQE